MSSAEQAGNNEVPPKTDDAAPSRSRSLRRSLVSNCNGGCVVAGVCGAEAKVLRGGRGDVLGAGWLAGGRLHAELSPTLWMNADPRARIMVLVAAQWQTRLANRRDYRM
ncbi:hypothetical protein KEM55_005568 [Ascosphaera atra]|nr:hypothetical protein KEM55_005568 [Ascosphaera atra]